MYCAVTVNASVIAVVSSLSQPVCFQPSSGITVGLSKSATVLPASGFTQYLVVPVIVPFVPGRNSTSTKFSGTSGLSSPGCGTIFLVAKYINCVPRPSVTSKIPPSTNALSNLGFVFSASTISKYELSELNPKILTLYLPVGILPKFFWTG